MRLDRVTFDTTDAALATISVKGSRSYYHHCRIASHCEQRIGGGPFVGLLIKRRGASCSFHLRCSVARPDSECDPTTAFTLSLSDVVLRRLVAPCCVHAPNYSPVTDASAPARCKRTLPLPRHIGTDNVRMRK